MEFTISYIETGRSIPRTLLLERHIDSWGSKSEESSLRYFVEEISIFVSFIL